MSISALMYVFFTIVAFVLFALLINESEKAEAIYLKNREKVQHRQQDNQKDHLDLSGGLLGI